MKTWLRQHHYALLITLRRLAAQPFSSLANILVMAMALALPLLGGAILVSVEPVARQVSVTPEVTAYMQVDAPEAAAIELQQRIRAEYGAGVADVRLVRRGDALVQLKENPAWSQALSVLDGNPLPDAVVTRLADGENLAERAEALATTLQKWDRVDRVQLDSAWVQRLETLLRFARIGLIFLAMSVAAVVLATIFNTVRMQALAQREEIGVARLVGATESFVRRPFLYLGGLSCAMAGLMAVGVSALLLSPLNSALIGLARSYGAEFSLRLPSMAILLLGIAVTAALGALSARWSVTRNTRF